MKTIIMFLLLIPITTNAIVISHGTQTENPQQKCDYSVAVDYTNRTVWKCYTEEEYNLYNQQREEQRKYLEEKNRTESWNGLKNNYFLLPIGFILFIIAVIFGGVSDIAAFLGLLSVIVGVAGFVRMVYQLIN